MRKLIIQQTKENNAKETVVYAVIQKLYNLGKQDDSNHTFNYGVDTSNIKRPITTVNGAIIVPVAYIKQLDYIRDKYPNLDVTATSIYIDFEDTNVEQALLNMGLGDGTGITVEAAKTVTLNSGAFKNNTNITRFNEFKYFTRANTMPSSELFNGCTNLESIDLSEVTSINEYQFQNTAITTVNIPNLMQFTGNSNYLGRGCFAGCSQIETITNLGHVSFIPDTAFGNTLNLQSVVLPNECYELKTLAFNIDQRYITNYGNILQSIQGLNHVTAFGRKCLHGRRGLQLTASDLAEAVTIYLEAFWYVSVQSINSPKLITLGSSAFRENNALTTVECLGKIDTIPVNCFTSDPLLQTAKLPYECTKLDNGSFQNCSSLTSLKQYTASVDNWVEGEVPETRDFFRITYFGSDCLRNCSQLSIDASILSNATYIGPRAFSNTRLYGDVVLNADVQGLGEYPFNKTLITSLDLSATSITSLGNSFVLECSNLVTVKLPSTCTTIQSQAFKSCPNLETIQGLTGNINLNGATFYGCSKLRRLDNIAIKINSSAVFGYCPLLEEITLQQVPMTIGAQCFQGCTSLTTINNSEYITAINGGSAFENCSALTALNFNDEEMTWTNVGSIFYHCSSLTTLGKYNFTFHGLTTIPPSMFNGCTNLEGILNFPDATENSNNSYGRSFNGCTKLVKISLPKLTSLNGGSPYSMDERAVFGGNTSLKIVDLGDQITNINMFNFYGCSSLKAVIINTPTVPTVSGYSHINQYTSLSNLFGNTTVKIYVPDNAVSIYQSTAPFSSYPDNIVSINSYNESNILES